MRLRADIVSIVFVERLERKGRVQQSENRLRFQTSEQLASASPDCARVRAADFDNLPDILVMNFGARVKHNARFPLAADETAGFEETVAGESK